MSVCHVAARCKDGWQIEALFVVKVETVGDSGHIILEEVPILLQREGFDAAMSSPNYFAIRHGSDISRKKNENQAKMYFTEFSITGK